MKFVFVQQNSPTCLDTNVVSMMSPEQPAVPPAALTPPTQTMSPDLEQTWMEILSLPELQVKEVCVYTYWSVQGFDRTIDQRMQQESHLWNTNAFLSERREPRHGRRWQVAGAPAEFLWSQL